MAAWIEPASIIGLIFGGCCSNVFALEAILKYRTDSGLLITFTQFLFIAFAVLPFQLSPSHPYFLAPTSVPRRRWAFMAFMFYTVNMLNNWAFSFNISVPVHIILRSFGSVTTIIAGWMTGKKYSAVQILSVGVLTVGVVIAAWADAEAKGKAVSTSSSPSPFGKGLLVLLAAQLLSSYMGVYVEDTYARYGRHWTHNLFYTHFLSLPFFFPLSHILRRQYRGLRQSPPLVLPAYGTESELYRLLMPTVLHTGLERLKVLVNTTPRGMLFLLTNAMTQLVCISGVNLLSAKTSAVTVTIALNVRKLVSFVFSIVLFGNPLSEKMVVGAALVFLAGGVYGWESSVAIPKRREKLRRADAVRVVRERGEVREMNGIESCRTKRKLKETGRRGLH